MNSFLQGKKTLAIEPLRSLAAAARVHSTASPTAPRPPVVMDCGEGTPSVEVVKEGDKIVRLVVVCTCGERVEIECLYPGGG